MTPLAWLIGLVLPACAALGAAGLPHPGLMDLHQLQRPASPNSALAAPAGFTPAPDIVTPVFPVPPERLYAAILAVAAGQSRTFLTAEYPTERQAHFVARSAIFNFPDLITVQVEPIAPDNSTLVLYSRSVYGYSDLGVNRKRLETWLAAVQSNLQQPVR